MFDLRLTEDQYFEAVDNLLFALTRETEQQIPTDLTLKQKRWLVDSLLEIRSAGDIDETMLQMQNKILNYELQQKGVKSLDDFRFVRSVANFNCPMDVLNVDVCVLFSCSLLPGVDDISVNESKVMLSAGLQAKESFANILQENHNVLSKSKIYAIDGFNLPCKKIVKILTPDAGVINSTDYSVFSHSVKELFSYLKDNQFKSVAFDCLWLSKQDIALLEILNREIKANKKIKILINLNKNP